MDRRLLIAQGEYWVGKEGQVRIAEMDGRYCKNVLDHLLRNAEWVLRGVQAAVEESPPPLDDEAAMERYASAKKRVREAESDPQAWIADSPLVIAPSSWPSRLAGMSCLP